MSTAVELVAELTARGIELCAESGRLRYRPQSAMTLELAERLKTHKAEVLAILVGGCDDVPDRPEDRPEYVTELVRRGGQRQWRQRRMDEADRSLAAFYAAERKSRASG